MNVERHPALRFRIAFVILVVAVVASLVTAGWLAGELARTRGSLSLASAELAATQSHASDLEAELAATASELTAAEALVGSLEDELFNLETNYARLTAGWGYVLRDPGYREMERFLERDQTSRQEYVEGEYTCVDFAAGVRGNAAEEGIRCAYVIIEFRGGGGHAIVAFDTTDRGLIFVEPQFDWEAEPAVGTRYYQCVKPPPGHYMAEPDYDDTITRIIVIW